MGTNYYWHHEGEQLHIGKAASGWCFMLHVISEQGIRDLPDWIERFWLDGSVIRDEYGNTLTADQMIDTIACRNWPAYPPKSEEWYRENHAEPGPAGLARFVVDGTYCVGHGDGTWDLLMGEFS